MNDARRQRQIEDAVIAWIKQHFDSVADVLEITTDAMWDERTANKNLPRWVRTVGLRLKDTLFAPVSGALGEVNFTPYRTGYAVGVMEWGAARLREVAKTPVKGGKKLSPRANRKISKIVESFFLRGGEMTRAELNRSEFIPPDFKAHVRKVQRESVINASDFHRGLSDGLRGVGPDAPEDRSDLATDIYVMMAFFWRDVEKFHSVTQLHNWLRIALPVTVREGDRDRIAKICQRIGLTFRERGRPKKSDGVDPG